MGRLWMERLLWLWFWFWFWWCLISLDFEIQILFENVQKKKFVSNGNEFEKWNSGKLGGLLPTILWYSLTLTSEKWNFARIGYQNHCVCHLCGSIEFTHNLTKNLETVCRTRWMVLASQINENDCPISILKITQQFLHFSFVCLWMWWLKQSCIKCLCIF